ncbi:ATP-grasp ribosomal peptide maturase [Embleya sp. NBC_00896]|uniref:ATP-grasp ribosomal peptide maturase n=1 Tax=Embleya sp. NBC_00896 TaxID=2975961 RepID=UPI00386F30C5|nr:ATP-grasp ribosomal peptide maturase [Embleya sp. NBC_00896]
MVTPPSGTIVVVTSPDDATVDPVVLDLTERGEHVVRFDTADFPGRAVLASSLTGGGWGGTLHVGTRTLDLTRIKSWWWRRPSEFRLPDEWDDTTRKFAASEARAGLLGVLGSVPALWVNHPLANMSTNYKPLQLAAAARVGLDIPDTIITTDVVQAKAFVQAHHAGGRQVIYKALGGGVRSESLAATVPTTVVDVGDVDASIGSTAVLLQERIVKAHEVRLTVVGPHMFAVAIEAHTEESRLDFRVDYGSLTYRVVDVPGVVAAGVRALMSVFHLYYGAIDFAVQPDGQWVFFEINANGQYRWLEKKCVGLGISKALADALADGKMS